MCEFVNNEHQCLGKKCYGNFCKKHKRLYLLDKDEHIIFERFTFKESDYLRKDLIKVLKNNKMKCTQKLKKDHYFKEIEILINSLKNHDSDNIIKIQKYFRNKILQNNIKLRGLGFIDRSICNNNEDFYTYDEKENIDDVYFISYTDNNKLTWCFDVRSINKLLELEDKNPYTREKLPSYFLNNANKITYMLKVRNLKLNYNSEIIKERKANIKQMTVDLFSEIEISGYDCSINWFLDLNIVKLKKLYKVLEDIWNYRAMLTQEIKNNIVPPNGIIFDKPIYQIDRMTSKRELQQLLLNDVSKFKTAVTPADKNLGFMYFLIGLAHVSPECYGSYWWLINPQ